MKVKGFQDTINWHNQNASSYSKSIKGLTALNQIVDFIELLPITNKKVLDAGCAAGRDSKILSEKSAIVTGVDISTELLKIAKNELPHITFIQGSFFELPFEDNTFGGIWACYTVRQLMKF